MGELVSPYAAVTWGGIVIGPMHPAFNHPGDRDCKKMEAHFLSCEMEWCVSHRDLILREIKSKRASDLRFLQRAADGGA